MNCALIGKLILVFSRPRQGKFLSAKLTSRHILICYMIMKKHSHIRLIDGEGGRATSRLIREIFLSRFDGSLLSKLADSAVAEIGTRNIAFTTDAFVVEPMQFPGGDIGKLAVCGTVNDLSAVGARPVLMSAAFIIEEGLEIAQLEGFVESMAKTALEAGVEICAGDTKVVPRRKGDGLFITTSGVGVIDDFPRTPELISPGDSIVISGDIARHAGAIVAVREGLRAAPPITSDCAPLSNMVATALREVPQIRAMRDPTRGGLGGVLCEMAEQSSCKFVVDEGAIPISQQIHGLCELYGYDPMFLACEGRMLFVVPEEHSRQLITTLKTTTYGEDAVIIGSVEAGEGVVIETRSGGRRLLVEPEGAPLPRIC